MKVSLFVEGSGFDGHRYQWKHKHLPRIGDKVYYDSEHLSYGIVKTVEFYPDEIIIEAEKIYYT